MNVFRLAAGVLLLATAIVFTWLTIDGLSARRRLRTELAEIRSTILFGFITGVVYPLLPDRFIDPWKVLNPRSVWLSIVIVSGLSFANYLLLRQFGKGWCSFPVRIQYSIPGRGAHLLPSLPAPPAH